MIGVSSFAALKMTGVSSGEFLHFVQGSSLVSLGMTGEFLHFVQGKFFRYAQDDRGELGGIPSLRSG